MKILRKDAHIPPITLLVSHLNTPCSSMALVQATPNDVLYLVVGKASGETVFLPTVRDHPVVTIESEIKMPICAIAEGNLRNKEREVVTIQANGLLQSLEYPNGDLKPEKVFSQLIYANVCSAKILDIDGDKLCEMVVMMTDRVVRSYRYNYDSDRLVPLHKWEMPAQISGWCIGFNGYWHYILLSQCNQQNYISIDFSSSEVKVIHVDQTAPTNADNYFFVCPQPYAADLAHYVADEVQIADSEGLFDRDINCPAVRGICCAGALTLDNAVSLVVTLDNAGTLYIYGWSASGGDYTSDPVAQCKVLSNGVFLNAYPYRQRAMSLVVSVVDAYGQLAAYLIDLRHVITV